MAPSNPARMFIHALLLFSYLTWINAEGINCYKCTILPPPGRSNEPNQICSQFDESSRFMVYCPKSTLCTKTTIHFTLANGTTITTVERGCASQRQNLLTYDFDERKWDNKEEIVTTAYNEGCFIGEDRGIRYGPAEYCYCSYHLCNGSQSIKRLQTFSMLQLVLLVLIYFAQL